MIGVSGSNITMTRGDTFRAVVSVKTSAGEDYTPDADERIIFTAKKGYNDADPVLQKQIDTQTMLLELYPEDTKHIPQPCVLVYDVKIIFADGAVDTFISGKINIIPEVG